MYESSCFENAGVFKRYNKVIVKNVILNLRGGIKMSRQHK